MINRLIFSAIFLIVLINFGSAVSLDLNEVYSKSETIITKISGNILEPLVREDIEFYRGHVLVPLDYDLEKIGDDWYIWAIAPEAENNYSLLVKDIVTTNKGKVVEIDFQQNFSVIDEYKPYNIKPGVIIAKESLDLEIFSFVDESQNIEVSFLDKNREYVLSPGMNEIKIMIGDLEESTFVEISVGDYIVPAYFIMEEESSGNGNEIDFEEVRFNPRYLESTILIGSSGRVYPFQIINDRTSEIEFDLDYNQDLFEIIPSGTRTIRAGDSGRYNLTLKQNLDEEISEIIIAKSGDFSLELPVEILITENVAEEETPYIEENISEEGFYTCSELKGLKCVSGESCNGKTVDSLDGACCLVGSCIAPESENNYAWVGWVLGVIVVLILGWAFVKYKKAKPSKPKFPGSSGSMLRKNINP